MQPPNAALQDSKQPPLWRDQLLLHITIFIWGFTGILGKAITLESIPLVWCRMGIAFISLLIILPMLRKKLLLGTKPTLQTLGIGLIIAAHWIFFFEAIKVSTVSVALACMSSSTLFVSFLEPLFFRKRIVGYEVLLGLFVIGGLLMIFQFETEYKMGIAFAVISAFLAGVFGTINGVLARRKLQATGITLWEMIGGFLGITIWLALTDGFTATMFEQIPENLAWLLVLGVVCTAFAFVISVAVMKRLSPFTVSISINLEPVYAILLALMLFGEEEHMSAGFYVGAAILIGSVALNALIKRHMNKRKPQMV